MTPESVLVWMGWVGAIAGGAVAAWALAGDRSSGRRRCPACFYDFASATVPGVCSECGRRVESERQLRRTRRRWREARLGLAAVLVAWVAGSWLPVRRDGWAAALPDWVLLPALGVFERQAADLASDPDRASAGVWTRWERLLLASHAERLLRGLDDYAQDQAARDAFYFANESRREFRVVAPGFARVAIESRSEWVARLAMQSLASCDPRGEPTRRALSVLAARADRAGACEAVVVQASLLAPVDPVAALHLVMPLLGAESELVVRQAALVLLELVREARPALPALRQALAAADSDDMRDDLRLVIDAIESTHALNARGR
ncbi:MAG: hypothetical protein AB7K52_10930 [Phycisphaerales bacterium]